MPTKLTEKAIERSTFVILVSFYDTQGSAVTPTAANWTLTDRDGNVVNGRANVDVLALGTEITILLKGDDLQVLPSGVTRILTIEAYYDSVLGTGLPVKDECRFEVHNLARIT
jgi:hypothetical protein